MFESISDKLGSTLKHIRGYGKLSETNIQDALREVRLSLLEADVNFKVVKGFIESVRERALGTEVLEGLSPGQQFVGIVHEELIAVLGSEASELDIKSAPPVGIMMVGLQGSGKTTTSAKLALTLKQNEKRNPLLVPADVYRPAAIEQIKLLGEQCGVDVYDTNPGDDPVDIAVRAKEHALHNGNDVYIIDTAGRLQIDRELMAELANIKARVDPAEVLFVADAMTGQEAVNVAEQFNADIEITGVVLTKMDGDARGGAALSIKTVTGKPIKFFGTGEKLDALEVFHPDRIASLILGMGDILSFIEKAESAFDEKKVEEMTKRILKKKFNLEDYKDAMLGIRKMGSIESMAAMIPGAKQMTKDPKALAQAEREMAKTVAIIDSMTKRERIDHTLLNGSRRKRIAGGSGTKVQDVNRMLKNYQQMRKMMKNMGKFGKIANKLMKSV